MRLSLIVGPPNAKTPPFWGGVFVLSKGEPDDYLLSHGQSALSSAWSRFTVLFGMGRGGTDSLWSSGMRGCCLAVGARQPIGEEVVVWGNDCGHSRYSASGAPASGWLKTHWL